MAFLSFNGRVHLAVDRVRAQHAEVQLIEAEGRASTGLIEHPSAIDRLRVLFRNGTTLILIEETGYGEFGAAITSEAPWGGADIFWPIEMDLPEADRLKEEFGYTDPYSMVTLRVPQGVAWANPSFVFGGNPQCPNVTVDTVTGRVREAR